MELIKDIIVYGGTYIGVPCFLFALFGLRKTFQTQPLLLLIVFEQLTTPLVGYLFIKLVGSNFLMNTYDNFLWILFLFFINKSLPRYTNYFFLLIIIQEVIHVIWFPNSFGVLIYFQLSIFAVLICGMNIYRLGLTASDKKITLNPEFLMYTGVIFYFSLSLVSYLFFDILIQGPLEYFFVITAVQFIAVLTLHSFIVLAIWRINWK